MNNAKIIKDAAEGITNNLIQIGSIFQIIEQKFSDLKNNLDLVSDRFIQLWFDIKAVVKTDIYEFLLILFMIILLNQILNLMFIFPSKMLLKILDKIYFKPSLVFTYNYYNLNFSDICCYGLHRIIL